MLRIANADDPAAELLRCAPDEGAPGSGAAGPLLAHESRDGAAARDARATGPHLADELADKLFDPG